jgi:signal transduction histidine kinase
MRSLALRITALCLGVAAVAVIVAGLVSARLVASAAQETTGGSLSDEADVVASQLANDSKVGLLKVVDVLRGQGITLVLIGPNGNTSSADPRATQAARDAGAAEAAKGQRVSAVTTVLGRTLLVEARPTPNGAFALVEEPAAEPGRLLFRNILFALAIGLGVAAMAGLLLARVLARPLKRAAKVAHAMSDGRRDLRVPVEGPAEVAEVADAVNGLANALQHSESRQREFLLSVSHELRTPLTAVSGFAESLADSVVTGEQVREVGRTIQQEAHRLDRLVSDLLDLARLGADDFRLDIVDVDLNQLVATAAQVWTDRCRRKGVRFGLELSEHPLTVHTDPRRLRQVIDGLAENALRVTPPDRPIVLSLSKSSNAAVLQVRDGGPGLSEEDYRVAFERGALHARYERLRPVGSGVGLALVHGLVIRMGGTIAAGPAAEGGAAFSVTMPLIEGHSLVS